MKIVKYIIVISLFINYSVLSLNLVRGIYKNRMMNFAIDMAISYYLGPFLSIAIIYDYISKRKTLKNINKS